MPDDATSTVRTPEAEAPAAKESHLRKLVGRIDQINWRKFVTFAWWWRWFRHSLMQSGRLTTLLALILLVGIRIEDPEFLRRLRLQAFDVYQVMSPRPFVADSPVVIIDIDERSIAEEGQWPWPRTVLSDFVGRLTDMEAKVIGFDVVFSEPDRTSLGIAVDSVANLDEGTRAKLKALPSNDEVFAERLKSSGRVVLGQAEVVDMGAAPKDRVQSSVFRDRRRSGNVY